ncbi:MAG: SocA family protein [candidate division WS1 bacterium]|jgi:uncharacterized phage-associated protein|nr:SocA family protein [candidate division WS1 bacterium]
MKIWQDAEKALEVLVYVAEQTSNMYNILKAIYIANKLHIAECGRLIYPERFKAMNYGPVPSLAYDIVKDVRDDRSHPVVEGAGEAFALEGNDVYPKREADLAVLSASERRCLDEAIRQCGHLSFDELKSLTHAEPAYRRRHTNEWMPLVDIAEDLGIPDLVDYLKLEGSA